MAARVKFAEPVSLTRLIEIGVVRLPDTLGAFEPASAWKHSYRIWACSGFVNTGEPHGLFRLERRPGRTPRTFGLAVRQLIPDEDKRWHETTAALTCRLDKPATPETWRVAAHFVHRDGHRLPLPASRESSSLEKLPRKRGPIACDWGLFEAVQRLPFRTAAPMTFTLLEGLSLPKENHRLRYVGRSLVTTETGQTTTVHAFSHIGHGILPFEYWLDEQHRLLAAVSAGRAFILEDIMATPLPRHWRPLTPRWEAPIRL